MNDSSPMDLDIADSDHVPKYLFSKLGREMHT